MGDDRYHLDRFVRAQDGTFDTALAEIAEGRKRSHWMWFIFPQFAGLGSSDTSRHFAIASVDEARAYLGHPILGPRLRQCADALLSVQGRTADEIFGETDAMKLRSSATLFASVSPADSPFHRVLDCYFDGEWDERTLQLIAGSGSRG
jgi:uncharacterized protein (DUF1810 family)